MIVRLLLTERAKELADKVGGQAITLAEVDNFHPEEGMVLANTTSVGMKPKIDLTPISKVCLIYFSTYLLFHINLASNGSKKCSFMMLFSYMLLTQKKV